MVTSQQSLAQTMRGIRTRRRLGCPAMGGSVNRRSTWSQIRQSCPQPGQEELTITGWQYRWVTVPASAALSMDRPSSAVRRIVSATKFGAAESVTVGWDMDPGVTDEDVEHLHPVTAGSFYIPNPGSLHVAVAHPEGFTLDTYCDEGLL